MILEITRGVQFTFRRPTRCWPMAPESDYIYVAVQANIGDASMRPNLAHQLPRLGELRRGRGLIERALVTAAAIRHKCSAAAYSKRNLRFTRKTNEKPKKCLDFPAHRQPFPGRSWSPPRASISLLPRAREGCNRRAGT